MKRMLTVLAALALMEGLAFDIVGDANSQTTYTATRKIITFRQSGTLTVTGSGQAEILLVGGGGGGGDKAWKNAADHSQGDWGGWSGGGGAGGLYYKQNFSLSDTVGGYSIVVGAGGAVGAQGGATTAFGLTAPGGGAGCKGRGWDAWNGLDKGGCGGGAVGLTDQNYKKNGGAVTGDTSDPDYHGFAGGKSANSYQNDNLMLYATGGGGGAGSVGYDADDAATPGKGGIGFACSITGSEVYYAGGGGGAGYVGGNRTLADGGLGGGGKYEQAGTDGLGGGGGAWAKGGSGVVIVSIPFSGYTEDFSVSATGDGVAVSYLENDTVITLTKDATVNVTGAGLADVLIVGGGGGGGENASGGYGGGGGAGGLYYKQGFILAETAGAYSIVVGAGGAVGAQGGATTAFGLTAPGGGAGCKGRGWDAWNGLDKGGCGGGAVGLKDQNYKKNGGVVTGDTSDPDYHGFAGGKSANSYQNDNLMMYATAGGGGAGGVGYDADDLATPGQGGVGFACSISGAEIYYAGGGGGSGYVGGYVAGKTRTLAAGGLGGGGMYGQAGTDGFGGGGGGTAKGGSGVVIIRFKRLAKPRSEDFDVRGGDQVLRVDGEKVRVFKKSGTMKVTGSGMLEVLVVGGGGVGGRGYNGSTDWNGGGGGGGAVVYAKTIQVTAGEYAVVVGKGGQSNNEAGGVSSVLGVTAIGGGAGGSYYGNGNPGASGGGSGSKNDDDSANNPKGGVGTSGLGFNGGSSTSKAAAGGGGGAGGVGYDGGDVDYPSQGGVGKVCAITGVDVYYGGGGAGSARPVDAVGGLGGGGNENAAGADGFGGGGGGTSSATPFKGGDGVVMVRYATERRGLFIVVK